MSSVIVTEKENGYLITMNATFKGNFIVGCENEKMTLFATDIGIWADLLIELSNNARGLVTIEIDGVEYTVTDPLWRNLFEAFDFYVMEGLKAARKEREFKDRIDNQQYSTTDGKIH